MTTPAMFRPSQAKEAVGYSSRQLYRMVKEDKIRIYKRGRCTFFDTQEVVDYIKGLGDNLGDAE